MRRRAALCHRTCSIHCAGLLSVFLLPKAGTDLRFECVRNNFGSCDRVSGGGLEVVVKEVGGRVYYVLETGAVSAVQFGSPFQTRLKCNSSSKEVPASQHALTHRHTPTKMEGGTGEHGPHYSTKIDLGQALRLQRDLIHSCRLFYL